MSTHTTALGTPCARTWSGEWIATIDATESQLGHRICGARLHDATPCLQTSDHPSGRCRFHGGFDLTGAPKGNRNHVIHGLYSRRLRTCSQTCPHWQTCPCVNANHDLSYRSDPTDPSHSPSTSSMAPSSDFCETPDPRPQTRPQSPLCPYQLTEYNTVLTDALAIVESQPHPNPMGLHVAHNVATLQVLVSTAATHMAHSSPWSMAAASPDSSPDTVPNLSAANAFFRLLREFRASLKLLHAPAHGPLNRQKHGLTHPTPEGILRHARRIQHDTSLDPDALTDALLEPQTIQTHAKAFIQQAALAGGEGREVEMCETFDNATMLDEPFADTERDHILASYRPASQSVSEEMAAQILGNLHLPPLPEPEQSDEDADDGYEHYAQVLQHYLDVFRDGKIPPEAFPKNTPIRACAESIYQGPPIMGATPNGSASVDDRGAGEP